MVRECISLREGRDAVWVRSGTPTRRWASAGGSASRHMNSGPRVKRQAIVYDGNGVLDHALRYTDKALVGRCRDFIAGLYGRGEPVSGFFRREIAPLPPPRPARQAVPHDYMEQAGRPQPHRP